MDQNKESYFVVHLRGLFHAGPNTVDCGPMDQSEGSVRGTMITGECSARVPCGSDR